MTAVPKILLLGIGDAHRIEALDEPASIDWILECVKSRSSAAEADLIVYSLIAPYDLNDWQSPLTVIEFLQEVREVNKDGEFWLCTAHDAQIGDPCMKGLDASAVIAPWDLKEALSAWCRQKTEEPPVEG